jgi:hypothetical protein
MSQVQVGEIPPNVAGGPIPIFDVCGHRFQVGTGIAVAPCALCGRYSVGKCQDCGRPLCGLHGTRRGHFLCEDCVHSRTQEQQRRQADQEEAGKRKRDKLNATLAMTNEVDDIVALILEHEAEISVGACKAAWPRVAGSDRFPPNCDLVNLTGRLAWISNLGKWSEENRAAGWRSTDSITISQGTIEGQPYTRSFCVVIDWAGNAWFTSGDDPVLTVRDDDPPFREHVILPVGDSVRTAKHRQYPRLTVVGGESIDQVVPEEYYVAAVAAVMRTAKRGGP